MISYEKDIPSRNDESMELPYRKKGLYFIGQTAFNPFTKEEFYWLKVGMTSSTFRSRFSSYFSNNPMVWKIDFLIDAEDSEYHFHDCLSTIAIEKGYRSMEWYRVTREEYLEACQKGFKYFQKF